MIENEEEIAKVRTNLSNWLAAFNEKNLDKLFSLYAADSMYANAGAPLLRGIEEIKPWYEEAFKQVEGTLRYKEEAAVQQGSLAMLLGIYYFEPPTGVVPPVDAELTGRVSLIYRREQQGDWKLIFDMDNTPPDVSPANFQ